MGATVGRGCATTALPETTPTVPPTPFPTPPPTPPPTQHWSRPTTPRPLPPTAAPGPVDPYNCAVGVYQTWDGAKQTWCCSHHHICVSRLNHRARQIPTIARTDSQIGRRAGLWPRRLGAVRTRARAAHRQPVVAPEPSLVKWLMHDFGAGLRAIFRRHRHASSQASTRALWAPHVLASALAPSSGAGLMSCSQWRDD